MLSVESIVEKIYDPGQGGEDQGDTTGDLGGDGPLIVIIDSLAKHS